MENFSKENGVKLAADLEFLPQDLEQNEGQIVGRSKAVAITRILSFFPD